MIRRKKRMIAVVLAIVLGIYLNQTAKAQNVMDKSGNDSSASGKMDRQFWIAQLDKLARPV